MLKFNKSEMMKLLGKLTRDDKIQLVGDHGIYIMSFNEKSEKRTIVYAEGCNPHKDINFYDMKEALYGGDDGCDDIGTARDIAYILAQANKYLGIKLTKTKIKVGSI